MIRYLTHIEIDKALWDSAIQNSLNGVIYATTMYLDQVSPLWDALVMDEYSAVMPLPVKRKWGFSYLIRPAFCQQLGIFSKHTIDEKMVFEFISNIASRFKWVNIPLNEANPGLGCETGINYILPLQPRYEMLSAAYVQNTRRNLGKSIERKITPEYSDDIKSLVSLKLAHAFSNVTATHQDFLISLVNMLRPTKDAEIIITRNGDGEILAGALFIHYGNRWIYLLSASTAKGKEDRAMFAIIDKFIRNHAGNLEFLDFEGSMIPELARFFAGFGAVPVNFPVLKINRLPFPLNLLKR